MGNLRLMLELLVLELPKSAITESRIPKRRTDIVKVPVWAADCHTARTGIAKYKSLYGDKGSAIFQQHRGRALFLLNVALACVVGSRFSCLRCASRSLKI